MALLDSEIARIKTELGFHVLSSAAVPWADSTAAFDLLVQPYVDGGASTTSSTTVTATDGGALASITLASATGFEAGARMVVDVDSRQEVATIRTLSGSVATAFLSLAHSGTYPVTVEGPETIVREILTEIRKTREKLLSQYGSGALKRVDEVEFYGVGTETAFGILGSSLAWYREQLASALGVKSMWSRKSSAAQTLSVY